MSILEDGREEGTHKRVLSPSTDMHETVRLQETATCQFWVTASTRVSFDFVEFLLFVNKLRDGRF